MQLSTNFTNNKNISVIEICITDENKFISKKFKFLK